MHYADMKQQQRYTNFLGGRQVEGLRYSDSSKNKAIFCLDCVKVYKLSLWSFRPRYSTEVAARRSSPNRKLLI